MLVLRFFEWLCEFQSYFCTPSAYNNWQDVLLCISFQMAFGVHTEVTLLPPPNCTKLRLHAYTDLFYNTPSMWPLP